MPDHTDVRDQISIPDVLELLGEELPPRLPGHRFCFRHDEDTPSLFIQQDHFFAFCCGVGGDVIDFLKYARGLSWSQSVAFLAGTLDDLHPRERVERSTKEVVDLTDIWEVAEDYFGGPRRFDPHALGDPLSMAEELFAKKWPHLPLDWVRDTFPVKVTRHALWLAHVAGGRVMGIKTRSLYTGDKKAVSGSTFTLDLYQPFTQVTPPDRPADLAVLVEGESDTWTMRWLAESAETPFHVYGLPSGARCWKEVFASKLATYRRVAVLLDDDNAGNAGADRILADLFNAVRVVVPMEYKDASEAAADGWTFPLWAIIQ